MNWIDLFLILAVLAGVTAGTALLFRDPVFWIDLGIAGFKAALPAILKRMDPKDEAAWREAEKKGEGDEWRRHRNKFPPKG